MKKLAFTLSELLITMAILALVAALTAPVVTDVVPDDKKLAMIKICSEVEQITEKMLGDDGLYKEEGSCVGLGCTNTPTAPEYKNVEASSISTNKKYQYLLTDMLGLKKDAEDDCYIDSEERVWKIVSEIVTDDESRLVTTITIDFNGEKGPNSVFTSNQDRPDQLSFKVDTYGKAKPADALMSAYLVNYTNLSSRKEDRRLAKKYLPNFEE